MHAQTFSEEEEFQSTLDPMHIRTLYHDHVVNIARRTLVFVGSSTLVPPTDLALNNIISKMAKPIYRLGTFPC